jgi:tetratricopeptide (TPR) repeat protein
MTSKFFATVPLCALALALALPACTGRKTAWNDDTVTPGPGATADAQGEGAGQAAPDSLVGQGDAKWAERTSAANVKAAIASWEKAVESEGATLDLLIKLTRAHYFLADGYLRNDEKEYLRVMDKGVEWGERAMAAASPEFARLMREKKKLPEAIKVVPKEGVPAMYWYASSLGKWAKKKGFAVLLGQKDNVKATMDRCLELDPEFFYGGPHRYFGAFYAIAPGFAGGDLEKSMVHFKKSLEISPNYVGTKVLWAQELAVKKQNEELFDQLLAEVLDTPDDAIPELKPEIIVEKEKAKELIAQKGDLF